MKKATILILLVAAGYLLTACNTFNGFGKDMERAGEKIQGASQHKN